MTTWEARELATWLSLQQPGTSPPVRRRFDGDDDRLQAFTEPNLAVSVASVATDQVGLRLHLSLESARSGHPQRKPFHLVLQLSAEDLQQAAEA